MQELSDRLGHGAIVVELLYMLMRQSPQHWWLIAWAVFLGLMVLLAQIAPVVLFPIFYKFEPLEDEELKRRLIILSERAGTRVRGVYKWHLSEKSKKANAALTGLGRNPPHHPCRHLARQLFDDEIEAVLAHELGHHVHRHILKSIFVQCAESRSSVSAGQRSSALRRGSPPHVRGHVRFRRFTPADSGRDRAFVLADACAQRLLALQRAPGRPLLLRVGGQCRTLHFVDEQVG